MKIEAKIVGLEHAVTTVRYAVWHFDELELRSFLLTSAKGMSAWFTSKEEEAEIEARRSIDPDTYLLGVALSGDALVVVGDDGAAVVRGSLAASA